MWSLDDLMDAQLALDLVDDLERQAIERQREESENRNR